MSSPLSGIPVAKRKQLAATLGLFAVLFLAVGAVAATGTRTGVVRAFIVIAVLIAAALALMAWGVLHSVRLDRAERQLDAAIEEAVRAGGRSLCDCGHEHDPDELHVVDGEVQHVTGVKCAHDGSGAACEHDCDACVLAGMRLAPAAAFDRPSAPLPATPPARRPRPGPGLPRR